MLDNLNPEPSVLEKFEAYLDPPQEAEVTEEVEAVEEPAEVEAEPPEQSPETIKAPLFDDAGNVLGYEEITPQEFRSRQLMQSDYTRKTQATAEERKAVEAKAKEVEGLSQKLSETISALEAIAKTQDEKIDWDELRTYDPSEYLRQRELQAERSRAIDNAKAQQKQLDETRIKRETELLFAALPTWSDPKQREADVKLFETFAKDKGFSPDFVNSLTDHRLVLMALDAARYHDLQNKKQDVISKKVTTAPKVTKPGKQASQPPGTRSIAEAKERFKKTRSEADGIKLFENFV